MSKFIDLTGKKFSMLTAIKRIENAKNRATIWECKCDCGNITKKSSYDLQSLKNMSCGCQQYKFVSDAKTTHGMTGTKHHSILRGMKSRCYNKNNKKYKNYGGRGILICNRWLGENGLLFFKLDMGEIPSKNHSIERIDVNGNYEPGNCVWATSDIQSRNKTNNVKLKYNGITMCISDWAKKLKIPRLTLNARLFIHNWTIEKAFTTPVETRSSKLITIDGETKTASEWSRILKISRVTVVKRYSLKV